MVDNQGYVTSYKTPAFASTELAHAVTARLFAKVASDLAQVTLDSLSVRGYVHQLLQIERGDFDRRGGCDGCEEKCTFSLPSV